MDFDIKKELQNMFLVENTSVDSNEVKEFTESLATLDRKNRIEAEQIPVFENSIMVRNVFVLIFTTSFVMLQQIQEMKTWILLNALIIFVLKITSRIVVNMTMWLRSLKHKYISSKKQRKQRMIIQRCQPS